MRLGDHTITRLRYPVGPNDYGNTLPDLNAEPDRLAITGCSVQPGTGMEFHDAREAVSVAYTVWAPSHPDVKSTDYIEYDGTRYPIEASPEVWDFSPMSHTVIRLRVVDG